MPECTLLAFPFIFPFLLKLVISVDLTCIECLSMIVFTVYELIINRNTENNIQVQRVIRSTGSYLQVPFQLKDNVLSFASVFLFLLQVIKFLQNGRVA